PRQGEHKLVGRRRTEYGREIRHELLRGCGRNNIRWIGQGPRWSPPDANGMLIVFDLASVGHSQLGVVTDGVVHFAGGFPVVLRNGADELIVIPAVGGRRSDVRRRDHVQDTRDVRVIARRRHFVGARREAGRVRVGVLPNRATAEATQERRIATATRDGSRFWHAIDRCFAEIAPPLFRGRHVVVDRRGGGVLVHVFV